MLSKEEIEKDIFYKNLYMQQPFTLLTDENLRALELHCEKTMHYGSRRAKEEHSIVLELIRKYKELESDNYEQNNIINDYIDERRELIEKLEGANKLDKQIVQNYENMYRNATEEFYKRSYKRTIDMANARREVRKGILSILKGEKYG